MTPVRSFLAIPVVTAFILIRFFSTESIASSGLSNFQENEAETFSVQNFVTYDGALINCIKILGLQRTSERAVRFLLGGKEGSPFSSKDWAYGLTKLYNTNALYDIKTEIRVPPTSANTALQNSPPRSIDIELTLKDKWTLVPEVNIQGGGGSTLLALGGYDNNVGGYFTNVSASGGTYNGLWTYDFNQFQEWLLDTDWMFGFDFSRSVFWTRVQDQAGNYLQNFDWVRSQQQILVGSRFGQNIRLLTYIELFQDSILNQDFGQPAQVFSQLQYRLQPTLIFGRSNLTNYLEEGSELSITPGFINFFNSPLSYTELQISFKKTTILSKKNNLATHVNWGIMTQAPIAYQFHLGGYDSVRGFSTSRLIGTQYVYGNFEYRPNLITHRFDWSALDLITLQGCVFIDSGWMAGIALLSAGLGVRLIPVKYSGTILRLDWAKTISPSEGVDLSFSIGQFF